MPKSRVVDVPIIQLPNAAGTIRVEVYVTKGNPTMNELRDEAIRVLRNADPLTAMPR